MAFKSEAALKDKIVETGFLQSFIEDKKNTSYVIYEPKGLFGIPDVMLVHIESTNGKIEKEAIAFELKLRKWKRALVQAYKYRAFAEISYVILDDSYINPALKNIGLFISANIGLLSIDETGEVKSHFEPTAELPYSEHYSSVVLEKFQEP
jgi:hypothetical protein